MKVPVGIGPPNTLSIPITSAGLDLTTVTGVTLRVWRPDETEATARWTGTASFASTSSTAGTVSYAFVGTEFTPNYPRALGEWVVAPYLTVAGGSIPCASVRVFVTLQP